MTLQTLERQDTAARPRRAVRGRLDSLTGLRALAAAVVFVHHIPHPQKLAGTWEDLTKQGAVGVTFFFALSGFVLTWSLRSGDTTAAFYRRRFARIYPALFVSLVAGLLVTWHLGQSDTGPQILAAFLGVQSWVPDPDTYFAVNGVTWSLSCELFFYLTFPLYAGRLFSTTVRQRRIVQAGALLVILAVAVLTTTEPTAFTGWLSQHCPAVRLMEFLLGALVAVDLVEGTFPPISWAAAAATTIAAYLLSGSVSAFGNIAVPIIPFLLLIGASAAADRDGRGTWLNRRWLVWLGEISYSFYLVHQLVIKMLGDQVGWPVLVVCSTVGAVAAAVALHYLVERPLERRLRGSNSLVVAGAGHRS